MGTESQHSMPELTPTAKPPAHQAQTTSHPGSGVQSGETAVSGMEERDVVRGTRVGGTYVRTRLPHASHISQTAGAESETRETRERMPGFATLGGRYWDRLQRRVFGIHLPIPQQVHGWLNTCEAVARRSSNPILLLDVVVAGVLLMAFILTRFGQSTWIAMVLVLVLTIVLVPLVVTGFRGHAKHEARMGKAAEMLIPACVDEPRHVMIVPLGSLNQPTLQCLTYARSFTSEVRAVYVATDEAAEAAVRADWRDWVAACRPLREHAAEDERMATITLDERAQRHGEMMPALSPRLVVIESLARDLLPPLLAYIVTIRDTNVDATVTVIVPECVPSHWWQPFLQSQTTWHLKRALYRQSGVMVTTIPYHLPK